MSRENLIYVEATMVGDYIKIIEQETVTTETFDGNLLDFVNFIIGKIKNNTKPLIIVNMAVYGAAIYDELLTKNKEAKFKNFVLMKANP